MVQKVANADGELMEVETIDEVERRAYQDRSADGALELQIGRERRRVDEHDDALHKESVRAQLAEDDLQTQVALEGVRIDAAISAESSRAQTTEDDLQTQAALEGVRIDAAILTESYRAQLAEDDIQTQCGLGLTRDNLQDTMFCKSLIVGTVAAGTDAEKPVFVAPNACRLSDLKLVNSAALAIDAVDNTKLELINKGADGTGTTVLATFDSATEAFVAFDAIVKAISGPVDLVAGDVLSLKKTDTGTGAAGTELFVAVSYSPIP